MEGIGLREMSIISMLVTTVPALGLLRLDYPVVG